MFVTLRAVIANVRAVSRPKSAQRFGSASICFSLIGMTVAVLLVITLVVIYVVKGEEEYTGHAVSYHQFYTSLL